MLVTEKEAKKTECPIEIGQNCVGTDCMAWRWGEPELVEGEGVYFPDGRFNKMSLRPRTKDEPRRGYCGLAGKPEYES
jgi:hypothetical protein